jgi:long-subunit fatty acid transport protein
VETHARAIRLTILIGVFSAAPVAAQQTAPGGSSAFLSAPVVSGARAMGMGGAFLAVADDLVAGSWNPAGLARIEQRRMSVGGDATRIAESVPSYERTRIFSAGLRVVESGPSIAIARRSRGPDFAAVAYPLQLGRWRMVPQFTYRRAVKMNFGESTSRPYEYVESTGFREDGADVLTIDAGGGIDTYAGAVGVQFHRAVAIGAAVNVWRGRSDGTDRRTINATYAFRGTSGTLAPSGYSTVYEEALDGTSVDVGVLLVPVEWLRIGGVFRNSFEMTRTYQFTREYTNWIGRIQSENYSESGTIDWPSSAGVGAAFMLSDALTLSTDYTRSSWSGASYQFSSSNIQVISTTRVMVETAGTVLYPQMFDPARPVRPYFNIPQHDASQLSAGAEFVWRRFDRRGLAGIPLRAGVYRNRLPTAQSDGSDLLGVGITAGAGVRWRRLNLDVAYVRESASGKMREFPMTAFAGFSETQQQGGSVQTVFHRLLFSAEARFLRAQRVSVRKERTYTESASSIPLT